MKPFLNWIVGRVEEGRIAVIFLLLLGCSSTGGHRISRDMTAFIQPGVTTREEVVENLGRPVIERPEEGVMAYLWEKVRGTARSMTYQDYQNATPLLTGPAAETSDFAGAVMAYCVSFDAQHRVRRAEFVNFDSAKPLAEQVVGWAKR